MILIEMRLFNMNYDDRIIQVLVKTIDKIINETKGEAA